MLGMIADGTGYILLAFATRGWMAFRSWSCLLRGGIGMPALQAMLSRQVDEERQGQLQGSLAAPHQPDLDRRTPPLHGDLCGFYNNVERVGMDCRRCPLLALPAGAGVAGFGAAQGNEPIADRGNDRPMPCGSRRLPASYTRPRSAVGTLAQPDTPDHEAGRR
ncbi:tetracycline efflux protein [Escherichia coli]|nr:tetracycline efflux protein [Escherichia coli]